MKSSHKLWLLPLGIVLLLGAACADPAADKPDAEVSEPIASEEVVADDTADSVVLDLDPDSTTIGFIGSKVTGSHEGGFENFEGTITLVDNDPTRSKVDVVIDTTSLWADDDRLTNHLKSADFFEVETYPTATFNSTSIEVAEDGYKITGNLNLHGVEKQIAFPAKIEVLEGAVRAQAEFSINRFDFEIVFPGKPDDLIREKVVIQFDLATEGLPVAEPA